MAKTSWLGAGLFAAALACGVAGAATDAGPPDSWITMMTKVAVLGAVGARGAHINVDTVDGQVTLHGQVASEGDRKNAGRTARGIKGVSDVRNLLQVVSVADRERDARSDEQIMKDVSAALRQDKALKNSRMTVESVKNGRVRLRGEAEGLSDHLRAIESAREVRGVRSIDSEIRSDDAQAEERSWRRYREQEERAQGGIAEGAGDLAITAAAKTRLLADFRTPARSINVDTENGVVTLFGSVTSMEAKLAAEEEARKVAGVKEVINRLRIAPADANQ